VASPNYVRCVGCILFPVIALAIGAQITQAHHLTFADYLRISGSSVKGFVSQSVAWVAWLFWVVKIVPTAIQTMRHPDAISVDGKRAAIFDQSIALDAVSRFFVKKAAFDNRLVAQTNSGYRDCGSIVLLRQTAEEITSRLNSITNGVPAQLG
jgi:hypothetical protein